MKEPLRLLALSLLLPILAGCEFVITGSVDVLFPPGFSLYNASYNTSYKADVDGDSALEFVICDDRTTELSYHFDYSGDLRQWTSFLKGVTSGEIRGEVTLYPDTAGVGYGSQEVDVTYEILARAAPLVVSPQGITVVPLPDVIGYTRLYLRVNGYSGLYNLSSNAIPVLRHC